MENPCHMTRASEEDSYDPMMWDSAVKIGREEDCSLACVMNKDCRLSYIKRDEDEALCFLVNEGTHSYPGFNTVVLFKKTCRSGKFNICLF